MNPTQATPRPNKNAILKQSVGTLDLTRELKESRANKKSYDIAPDSPHPETPLDGVVGNVKVSGEPGVPEVSSSLESFNGAETGSKENPVQIEPGSKETGSKNDPVMVVGNSAGEGDGGSEVASSPSAGPARKNRLPLILHTGVLKPKDHFTAIPNSILRNVGLFGDPNDFMIYLRMFSMAFGFGRNTCDMSVAELMAYTKLGKNAVKRALDRLIAEQWLKIIDDFEPGQVARKWRVFTPWENGLSPEPTYVQKSQVTEAAAIGPVAVETESKTNSVQKGPGPESTPRGFIVDPVTGSKTGTYKTRDPKTALKKSFSQLPGNLGTYFESLKPQRKRASEWQAFEELQADFPAEDIAAALSEISEKGLPGGGSCHSPMAYLAVAMGEIMGAVTAKREQDRRRQGEAARAAEESQREAEETERNRLAWERREEAFRQAFEGQDEQEVITGICREHGFAMATGKVGRMFAISRWTNDAEGRIAG